MKVLVTGGLGFIGSNFCKAISNQHDVTILDSRELNSGYNRLHETLLKKSCRIIFTKIEDYNNLESLISHFDIVYHFAGQGGHLFAEDNPLDDIDQNIRNTVMILEAISKVTKKPKLIFLSTRQIYGNVTHVPVDEINVKMVDCTKNDLYELLDNRTRHIGVRIDEFTPLNLPTRLFLNSCDTLSFAYPSNLHLHNQSICRHQLQVKAYHHP